jgi:hypothetical protein
VKWDVHSAVGVRIAVLACGRAWRYLEVAAADQQVNLLAFLLFQILQRAVNVVELAMAAALDGNLQRVVVGNCASAVRQTCGTHRQRFRRCG